jgi:hypothetical protein
MKGKRGKEIAKRRKAVIAAVARIGWTRGDWINEVETALGEAFIAFAKARLCEKNGQRRRARSWMLEFDRILFRAMIDVQVHPVRRNFDRKLAFEQALTEMNSGFIERLRAHVEREYATAVGRLKRRVDGRDIKGFWRAVREGSRVMIGG